MRLPASAKRRGYWLYRHVVPRSWVRLDGVDIYADVHDPRLARAFTELLSRPDPLFVARIGGSDFTVVNDYFNDPVGFLRSPRCPAAVARVQELNGYFDFAHDPANFVEYLDEMILFYRDADCLLYCTEGLIAKFRHNVFQKKDLRLLGYVCRGKSLIDYTFIESVMPFLESFRAWGQGKRILIVSPFARSLEFQYARLDDLIVGYRYPEFELVTYKSPITYSVSDDTRETLGVDTEDWHQQCRKMAEEIGAMDFDIALLSCASYSMYLGHFVRRALGRKAMYLGGILNVLFNIYGERYDTPFFNGFMRADTQMEAFENEEIASLRGGRTWRGEALGAYFGRRSP